MMMATIPITPPIPKTVLTLPTLLGSLTDRGGPGTRGAPRPGSSWSADPGGVGTCGWSSTGGGLSVGGPSVPPGGSVPPCCSLISALPFVCLVDFAQNPIELAACDRGPTELAIACLIDIQWR